VESPPRRLLLTAFAGALVALLVPVYSATLHWLYGRWQTDPFYSHGPLVPIVSAFLLWRSRDRLKLDPALSLPGVALLVGAAILHLLGVRLMFEFLSAVSILLVLAAVALLAGGPALLRVSAFPLLYLLFAIPLPMILLQQISLPLQLFSSVCAAGVLRSVGGEVVRHGVLLTFPKFTLAVADACSGLRSLLTVLAISTLAAHLSTASLGRKAALVAVSSVAALLVNILRILLAGLIGLAFDGETACLLFERYSGYFFFALVVLSTAVLFKLLNPPATEPPAPAPAPAEPLPARRLATAVILPLIALAVPLFAAATALRTSRASASPVRLADWQPEIPGWKALEVQPRAAFPGEEQVTGLLRDERGRTVRFNVLHSVSGRYLHSPEACSSAAGWIPERQTIDPGLPAHVWVLRRGSERACVIFWFDLAGRPRAGSLDQHAGALAQRLWRGSMDSAYGEISLPLPPGSDGDVAGLVELSTALHDAVRKRIWP
jgi:exosortase